MMNKISRFAAVFAVLFLVFGLSGCFFFPKDSSGNAEIGSGLALASFLVSNDTNGKLTSNITYDVYLQDAAGKTKTLDLNGHTITISDDIALIVQGNLTITDTSEAKEGKILTTSEETYNGSYCAVALSVYSGGVLTINADIDVESKGIALQVTAGGKASASDGTFKGLVGITVSQGATITDLSGCTVDATAIALYNKGTIDSISGGEYYADNGDDDTIVTVYGLRNEGTITNISAGRFDATQNTLNKYALGLFNQGTITSNSGAFYATAVTAANAKNVSEADATNNTTSSAVFEPAVTEN